MREDQSTYNQKFERESENLTQEDRVIRRVKNELVSFADSIVTHPSRTSFPRLVSEGKRDYLMNLMEDLSDRYLNFRDLCDANHIEELPLNEPLRYAGMLFEHEATNTINQLQMASLFIESFERGNKESEQELIDAGHMYSMAKAVMLSGAYFVMGDKKYNQEASVDFQAALPNLVYNTGTKAKLILENSNHTHTTGNITSMVQNAKNSLRIYPEIHGTDSGLLMKIKSTTDTYEFYNNGTTIDEETSPRIYVGGSKTSTGFGLQLMVRNAQLSGKNVWHTSQGKEGRYSYSPILKKYTAPRHPEGTVFEISND